ncbi:hypothetical protein SAM23877_3325 [Streptomyces ambofaciens ATCC 23877]|uniref:Uncharacterized protein n=1 Tax=Streptomyces ambofaciens (strain ATCC 23877 / 3486 / DSM 40053 / JCM 4204 / NBRC 12836 / NRRL B-2516) TaxID=278992 RepID=A0A0K2AU61_STRA7|nr:hypothetical protein SAM23877_3325 [Streptomyces ambofaciens ATCC 23877]
MRSQRSGASLFAIRPPHPRSVACSPSCPFRSPACGRRLSECSRHVRRRTPLCANARPRPPAGDKCLPYPLSCDRMRSNRIETVWNKPFPIDSRFLRGVCGNGRWAGARPRSVSTASVSGACGEIRVIPDVR